jgi:hypothetical protein
MILSFQTMLVILAILTTIRYIKNIYYAKPISNYNYAINIMATILGLIVAFSVNENFRYILLGILIFIQVYLLFY